jgi:RHS repeat-associated protein
VTDAAQNETQYAYDTENNLLSITDALGRATSFHYDAFGRVTETDFPSSYNETYAYDAIGNLTSKTDRKGQTINYVYDALNRLTHKGYPDSTGVDYVYDLVGKIQQVNDPTGTYGFAYDGMGRLIGTTTQYSFLPARTFSNAYAYDKASNRTGYTDPESGTVAYGYDALNRLTSLNSSLAGNFGFGYDDLSRRTSLTRPNGVVTNYGYDNLSRLLSVLHKANGTTTIDGAGYTYDNAGNRMSKTNQLSGITENYTYDAIYQLQQVTQAATTTENYTYDHVGNRQTSLDVASYSYDTSNQLTSADATSFTYDHNGNTLMKTDSNGQTTYAWDYENRLGSLTLPNGGGVVSFKYDPFGRRIQKVSTSGTTTYVYDGANGEEEVNASGAVIARYVQGAGIDEPLAQSRSGLSYYNADGLGSITSLTDSTGMPTATFVYGAFGVLNSSTGTTANSYRYTAREYDQETGLYYYRARYYDPVTGRFISEDPIGFKGGFNFYNYAANNPVLGSDPTGLSVYIVTYTYGNGKLGGGDNAFMLAALTRANEIQNQTGFNPANDIILFAAVSTKAQLEGLMNTANSLGDKYGPVDELSIYSHSGDVNGPIFPLDPGGRADNQYYPNELAPFQNLNWGPNAKANFYGCHAANFAQYFANATGVSSYGYASSTGFSRSPNSYNMVYSLELGLYGGPLYMVSVDGSPMRHY